MAEECLDSGEPREKWDEMLAAQGADLEAFNEKLTRNHVAPVVVEIKSPRTGFVSRCDARIIGEVVRDLGGGRLTKESVINYDVGVDRLAKPGEAVSKGSLLARIHAVDVKQAETAGKQLKAAFEVSARKPKVVKLISQVIA